MSVFDKALNMTQTNHLFFWIRGGFQLPNLKPVNMISMTGSTPLKSTGSPPDASAFDLMSPRSGKDSNISLKSELSDLESPDINSNHARQVHVSTKTSDKEQNTDKVDVREFATATSECQCQMFFFIYYLHSVISCKQN